MKKWINEERELNRVLRTKDLAFVLVSPAEDRWNARAREAADVVLRLADKSAAVVFVDPAEAGEYCDVNQIMHNFTLVAYRSGEEVDRRRITEVAQVEKFVACHLKNPVCTVRGGVSYCGCNDKVPLGYSA